MQLCQLEKVCTPLWISPVKLLGTNIQDGAMAREGSPLVSVPVEQSDLQMLLNEVASEARSDSLGEECTEGLLLQMASSSNGRRVHQLRLIPEHKREITEAE
jgi:hypothetical protein